MIRQKNTILEHLREIKRRLFYYVVFLLFTFGICYLNSESLYRFLSQPILIKHNVEFIYTSIAEGFFTYMKLSFIAAFALSTPFLLLQIYLFMRPGLYKAERIATIAIFLSFCIMFLIGCAVLYYGILPNAIDFLLKYQNSSIMPFKFYAKISEYVQTIITFMLAFGISFQMPLVIILFNRIGLMPAEALRNFRRMAIVLIFIISAIITPPDVLSQIILSAILMIFYEITILLCKNYTTNE